jgi:hypothetical protein
MTRFWIIENLKVKKCSAANICVWRWGLGVKISACNQTQTSQPTRVGTICVKTRCEHKTSFALEGLTVKDLNYTNGANSCGLRCLCLIACRYFYPKPPSPHTNISSRTFFYFEVFYNSKSGHFWIYIGCFG